MEENATSLSVIFHLAEERKMLYNRSSITFVDTIENEYSLGDVIMKHYAGTGDNNSKKGHGIAEFTEGHRYEGDFHNGLMHGKGRYTWKDGLVYEGEFNNSHLCGRGTYTWPDGSTYTGDVRDGLRDGHGTFHCPTAGVKYVGQWTNGKRHGKGKLVYDDPIGESYYEGEWVDDQQTGWGERCYKSGNIYKGQWLGNRRHGQGTMYWHKQQEQYSGEWASGAQHGHGEHIWFRSMTDTSQYPLQNSYVGEWRNGMREGFGTFHYASGAAYIGQWHCNQKEGPGKYIFQNGQVFEGTFTKDRMAGESRDLRAAIRPQTPLGSLLGDMGTSCTEQFNINVAPVVPPSCDVGHELRQIHTAILRHISLLRKVYHVYSSLEAPLSSHENRLGNVMTRMQLWQLLKDCRLQHIGMSLSDADNIIDNSHEPTTPFLMREFLQALVFLAYNLFHSREDCQSLSVGLLAQCFTYLISVQVAGNVGSRRGLLYSTANMPKLIGPYLLECWDIFCHLSVVYKGSVTLRAILLLLNDCGLIGEYLTSETAVHVLAGDNPLAGDRDSWNLDIKVVFLEFVEFLLCCSKCWYTAKEQKQCATVNPVVVVTSATNVQIKIEDVPDAGGNKSDPTECDSSVGESPSPPTTGTQHGLGDEASNTPATTLEANIPDQATTQERLVESTHNWEEIFKSFFLQFLPTSRAVLNKNS